MQNSPGIDPILITELRAGERVLWWGRPDPKRRMKRKQSQNVPVRFGFILAMFLLMIFLDTSFIPDWPYITSSPLSLFMLVVANLVVLFCVFYTLPAFRAYLRLQQQLRHTYYAITNQRALMMTALPEKSRVVVSYAKDDIGTISREEGGGGWGDLTFGILRPSKIGTRTVLTQSRFSGIPNVRQVEEIMFQTFKREVEPAPPAPGERISYEQ